MPAGSRKRVNAATWESALRGWVWRASEVDGRPLDAAGALLVCTAADTDAELGCADDDVDDGK